MPHVLKLLIQILYQHFSSIIFSGIIVTNTPDVLTETTAETTLALMLATARRFPEAIREAKTGGWGTWQPFYM